LPHILKDENKISTIHTLGSRKLLKSSQDAQRFFNDYL